MEGLHFYPRLTENLIEQAACLVEPYSFSYTLNDGVNVPLEYSDKQSGKVRLEDKSDIWRIEEDGLTISKKVKISYPEALYGPNGIAPQGAKLGLCIVWVNDKLTQTGIIKPVSIQKVRGNEYFFSYEFAPGTLSGNLTLDLTFYLETPANTILEGEDQLNNEVGVLLGSVERQVKVLLEDDYLDFPVGEMREEGGPLWRLEFYDWDDPRSDSFTEDSLVLLLNTARPECPTISQSGITNVDILKEILSSAYFVIFEKVKDFNNGECWDDTQTASGLDRGSICSILHWFSELDGDNLFDWNTPEGRMTSIKRIVDLNFDEDRR